MTRLSRVAPLLALLLLSLALPSCSWHRHVVGQGANGLGEESAKQFYVLFGLLRLNEVDSERMSEDLTSYEIVTERSFTDVLLAPLLIILTASSRTVTVYR